MKYRRWNPKTKMQVIPEGGRQNLLDKLYLFMYNSYSYYNNIKRMLDERIMKELLIRKKNRLSNYDYSVGGTYFVTVCSMARQNIFSKIVGTGLAPVRYLNGQPQGLSLRYLMLLVLSNLNPLSHI